MFGQTCYESGEVKSTYGTGNFVMMNTGPELMPSTNGLLTTVGYKLGPSAQTVYALEGAVAYCGSVVQWLRDNLRLIDDAPQSETFARKVADNGGMYFVPAFAGLFAPRWRGDARGVFCGMTAFNTRGHVCRAALEAAAYQCREVVDAMVKDSGVKLTAMKVDGGMTANGLLMKVRGRAHRLCRREERGGELWGEAIFTILRSHGLNYGGLVLRDPACLATTVFCCVTRALYSLSRFARSSHCSVSNLFTFALCPFLLCFIKFQCDMLECPVYRPVVAETTALGAAYAAGLAVGVWKDLAEVRAQWRVDEEVGSEKQRRGEANQASSHRRDRSDITCESAEQDTNFLRLDSLIAR